MRVVRVADVAGSALGGMVGAMRSSGDELETAGHQVFYLFHDDLAPRWTSPRVRRLVVPWTVVAAVGRLHRQRAFDVVEIHEPLAAVYAMVAGSRPGRRYLPPLVVLSHGIEKRCWQTVLERRAEAGIRTALWSRASVAATVLGQARIALRRADHVVVLNQADDDHLRRIGIPPIRISRVANGVDQQLLTVSRRPADHLRVLFLGSWLERKGVRELVEAWDDVHAAHPSARLTIAGTGDAQPLERFGPGARSSVKVVPHVERPALGDLLAAHDVFVLPSWFEGMPLAALEAAAASLAIVATRIPGAVDIFRPPEPDIDGALLLDGHRPAELAAAIGRLADDPELLAKLQAAARRRARAFTWTATAEGLAAAYAAARRAPATASRT